MSLLAEMLVEERARLVVARCSKDEAGTIAIWAEFWPDRNFEFHWNGTDACPTGGGPVVKIEGLMTAGGVCYRTAGAEETLRLALSGPALEQLEWELEKIVRRSEELGVKFLRKTEIAP